ncbi:hypothetical protein OG946_20290 [Streptomyces sp. NBC_01808]|uniref:hypothetical protein n=1 Tax=Streptomyces sp. NBC_01808 TaxID=2975947 RepID=UPI002DDA62A3|nr:hypothetical protein [Streptomyces sp. NBC_01808]WSA39496.1 hypothetical protein OG946_20290 [Streptomyces sp. NBC_01808]
MNRNRKHPAKAPYRRKATSGDRTKNTRGYRVTGSWDARPDRPAIKPTQDKKARDRIARQMADQGAYVVVEEHVRYGVWRTVYELDGPALAAERDAEQALAAAGHPPTPPGYRPNESDRHRSWLWLLKVRAEVARRGRAAVEERRRRLAVEAATTARELMTPPAIVRPENRQRARHVTGAQR